MIRWVTPGHTTHCCTQLNTHLTCSHQTLFQACELVDNSDDEGGDHTNIVTNTLNDDDATAVSTPEDNKLISPS